MGRTAVTLITSLVSCKNDACYTGRVFRRARITASLAAALVVFGCKKAPEPANTLGPSLIPPAATVSAHSHAMPAASAGSSVQVTWVDPPEWKRAERASPMRKATYLVPRASGDKEDGELGVFYFGPGQGGAVEANVDRWIKQFPDAKLEDVKRADRSVNGLIAHTVAIDSASFNAGAMGMPQGKAEPKANYGLLGAIVETPAGAYFFKLTGPKATVAAAKAPFDKLLESIRTSG
jgi:hypothetical protein